MSAPAKLPDGNGDVPVVDASLFDRILAILADRGEAVQLPAAAEARAEPVPLVVIERSDVFAAGVMLRPQFLRPVPALRERAVVLVLAADGAVTVDLGDGSGPRNTQPGELLSADFAGVPAAQIAVTRDGRTARCSVPFDDGPAPLPTETWTLPGGTASVLPSPGRDVLRCPLVVVEGFPGGHGFLYSHDVLAQQGVLKSLQSRGYDLVVVGLQDGTRPLQENADVVRAALAEVMARTELPITLLGWSMGGLLARLAVAAAESEGEAHRVETLLTWDTPHRGTMTQLGVQWVAQQFAEAHPALERYRQLLSSSANREMDMLVVGASGGAAKDPARAALEAALAWPDQPRRLLVASGRGDGRRSLRPDEVLMRWQSDGRGEICLRALGGAEPVARGWMGQERPAPLDVAGQPSWDGAPGGRETYVGQVATLLVDLAGGRVDPAAPATTCTVPTVSALDLDLPPDAPVPIANGVFACLTDQQHLGIDAQAATRLLEALGESFDPDRFDPHDPAFLADPFPTYARFREFAPIHSVAAFKSLWCFRASDCRTILDDTKTWLKHPPGRAEAQPGPMSALAGLKPGLFNSDPPDHTALRQAVEVPLRAALGGAPDLARTHARRVLDALGPTERIELVQDYALPVPANVLFDLLGIAQEQVLRDTLVRWVEAIALAHDTAQSLTVRGQGATCAMALRGFSAGLVDGHREKPMSGLIGAVTDAFAAGDRSDAELIGTLCDLLVAGYLSTTFIIATGLWRALKSGTDLAPLRAGGDTARAAVDELLRLDGPVQVIDRFATFPTTLAGRELPAGTRVTAVIGSADRDPAVFADPDAVQLERDSSNMAFGAGIHTCVGAPLARLVAPVALEALLEFAPDLRLDGEPQWQTDPYLRSAISVPLALGRRRA